MAARAVPLTFEMTIDPAGWSIRGPAARSRRVKSPMADEQFLGLVASLREWASRPVALDRHDPLGTAAFVLRVARRLSARLTGLLLADEDRRLVVAALAEHGPARLAIRAAPAGSGAELLADTVLALPWELLDPEGTGALPARDGRLTVIREAVTDQAPHLAAPRGPLTLAVIVAAPEDRADFAYEQESFRLLTALAPLGQRAEFANLGELDDLSDLVAELRATAIHFRGHGVPGGLLFEDGLGFATEVAVAELRRRLAAVLLDPQRAGAFPALCFLAAPYSALAAADTSAAAALHRGGFAQVVGCFGPVDDELSTRVEERFYGALAAGRTTLGAVEEARAALREPVGEAGDRVLYPFAWCQLAFYHRGPDLPLARPGPGGGAPPVRRRTVEVSGLPMLEHGFVGRRALQHEARRRVEHDGQRLLVIQGLGGLGKTALASHLLVRAFAPLPADQLVLRCQALADRDGDAIWDLRAQAEAHGRFHRLPLWDERVKELREAVPAAAAGLAAVLRQLRRERPGLAVYIDNAEALQVGPATDDPAALGSWRPGLAAWWREMERLAEEDGCLVMVTTRYAWEGLSPRAHLGLPPMERSDSLRLIDLFAALGDLPLAVRVRLAAQVDGHPRTVEILDRLVALRRRQIGAGADAWTDLIAPVLPAQGATIRADLLLSRLWDKLSPAAQEHARRLTVLRRPAPRSVIDRLGGARAELIRSGCLTRYREQVLDDAGMRWDVRWSFHVLVRELAERAAAGADPVAHRLAAAAWEERLSQPEARREDQREAIYHLHRTGFGDRAWPIVRSYVLWLCRTARLAEAQDLLAECAAAGTTGDALAVALSLTVRVREERGERGQELGELLDRAAALAGSAETRATVHQLRATWLLGRRELPRAESEIRMALAEKAGDQGTATAAYGDSLVVLGAILDRQGRFAESERHLRESVRILDATQGESHPDSCAARHGLANALESLGRYEEAEALLRQIVAIEEATLGADHPSFAANLHGLCRVLEQRGKLVEAEHLCRKALALFTSWHGPTHPHTLSSRHCLASILASRGDYAASEKLLRDVIAAKSAIQAPDANILESQQVLAHDLWRQNKLDEAEAILANAAAALGRLPADHPIRDAFLSLASNLLEARGRRGEATEVVQQMIALNRRCLAPTHPSYLASLRALASLRRQEKRFLEAEGILRHLSQATAETLGDRHPLYGRVLQMLAVVREQQGELAESECLYRSALALEEEQLGADHPSTAVTMTNLAGALANQGRGEEAEPLLARALAVFRVTVGSGASEVADTLSIRAQVWQLIGNPACVDAAEEALALVEATFGRDHPDQRQAASRLRSIAAQGPSRDVELTRMILAARALEHRGDPAAAVAAQAAVVERARRSSGDRHGSSALRVEIFNLAAYRRRAGQLGAAVELFQEAADLARRLEAPDLDHDLQVLDQTRTLAALPREAWEARQAEVYAVPFADQVAEAAILARSGDIAWDFLLPRAREAADRFRAWWPTSRFAADLADFAGALAARFREGQDGAPVPERFASVWERILAAGPGRDSQAEAPPR